VWWWGYAVNIVFERFTERARQVVVLAQEEARALGHGEVGTEHVLLGLLREQEGIAARVLAELGVTLERTRAEALRTAPSEDAAAGAGADVGADGHTSPRQPPFGGRAKKALELALREALSLGHNYIGTEHMLLGLMRDGESAAARMLAGFGADGEKIRREIVRLLPGPGAAPTARVDLGGSIRAARLDTRARSDRG